MSDPSSMFRATASSSKAPGGAEIHRTEDAVDVSQDEEETSSLTPLALSPAASPVLSAVSPSSSSAAASSLDEPSFVDELEEAVAARGYTMQNVPRELKVELSHEVEKNRRERHRASESLPTLFKQIETAQSQNGTAAAAAILLARANELMGQSRDTPLLDEATKAKLIAQGQELQSFATKLMQDNSGTIDAVADVWKQLESKFDNEGSALTNEALSLWTQLNSSSEAKEIMEEGGDLLRQWKEYAASTEGQKLIEDGGTMIKSKSAALTEILKSLSTTLASTAVAAMSPSNASESSASPAVAMLRSLDPATVVATTDTIKKTGRKVNAALQDDDDVKLLFSKGGALLKSYSKDPLKDGQSPAPSDRSVSASPQPESKSASPTNELAEDASSINPVEAAGLAMKSGEAYLKSLRESEAGNKMLAKASVLLQQNKQYLTPGAMTTLSTQLVSDADARQQFITKIKDVALEFLLSYLPTIVVPPIAGEKDSIEYEISNIDLGGFKVDSKDVDVVIHDSNSIEIRATNISCEMKNLIWKYERKKGWAITRVYGSGTADAKASEVEFVLKLSLDYPENLNKKENSSSVASPSVESKGSKTVDLNVQSDDSSPEPASPAVSPTPPPSLPQRKRLQPGTTSPTHGPVVPAGPALPKRTSTTPRTKRDSVAPSAAAASNNASPSSSSSSAAAAASSVSPVAATVVAPVVSAPTAQSVGASIIDAVSDMGQPVLVMTECHVTLKTFNILIHTSGWLKTMYNFLLTVLQQPVKNYIEKSLNSELVAKSIYLICTINELAVDYIPLLQRIMIKATNAALAEDDPNSPKSPNDALTVASSSPILRASNASSSTSTSTSSSSSASIAPAVSPRPPVAPAKKKRATATSSSFTADSTSPINVGSPSNADANSLASFYNVK